MSLENIEFVCKCPSHIRQSVLVGKLHFPIIEDLRMIYNCIQVEC